MGVVYLAHDARLDRLVAIKSLPPDLAFDPARRERVEREARTLAAISHPNIGAIFGLERDDEGSYLVLELVDGLTLEERLERAPMAPGEAIEIARQVAMGLAAAHQRGIVHRDLKPANIKVRPDGVVKVLDFGIALGVDTMQASADAGSATIVATRTNPVNTGWSLAGTPGYMSPEQTRGKLVDHATDTWALGCILFECLTRRRAFVGETVADLIAATLLLEPDLAAIPANVPKGVRRVLQMCFVKDRTQRAMAIDELGALLEREWRAHTLGVGVQADQDLGGSGETVGASPDPASSARDTESLRPAPLIIPPDRTLPRTELVSDIVAALGRSRLVTLVGGAGCGGSTLAALVANAWCGMHRDGRAMWAWAGGSGDLPSVYACLASASGLTARGGGEAAARLACVPTSGPMLLVIDDVSLAASGLVETIVQGSSGIAVLAVARSALGVALEHAIAIPGLATPTASEIARGVSAEGGRLLLERVMAATPTYRPDSEAMAQAALLARRLGGAPAAIELAAGVASELTPKKTAERLDQRLQLSGLAFSERLPMEVASRVMAEWVVERRTPGELAVLLQVAAFAAPAPLRPIATLGGAAGLPDPSSDDPIGGAATPSEARVGQTLARLAALGLVNIWRASAASGADVFEVPLAVRTDLRARTAYGAALAAVGARHWAWCVASLEQALPRMAQSGVWVQLADRAAFELSHVLARSAPSGQGPVMAARALLRRYRAERGA
jgi:hypothetical protein